jgi:hypothetical protein
MTGAQMQPYVIAGCFVIFGIAAICCIVKAYWRYRIWRKEWQLTSMAYRGIPVDVGRKRKKHHKRG